MNSAGIFPILGAQKPIIPFMESKANTSLQGLKILSFESRRAREIGELIRRYCGEAVIAPSMREIPLSQNTATLDFLRQRRS